MTWHLGTDWEGYTEIVAGDRSLKVPRLVAWAHGKLDSPFQRDDRRDCHHRDGCTWRNGPENLEALDRDEHRRRHQGVRS